VALNTNFKGTQQFVLCGITLAQQCLKLHNMLPPNGIILGSGSTIVTNDGKEKKVFFIQLTIEVVEIPMLCSYGTLQT
jgi:peptide subunit release factor 1 (eRF1)